MARLGVLLATVAALVLATTLALRDRQSEVVGYNGARPVAFVATVAPHKPVCTPLGAGRSAPDDLRLTVGSNGVAAQPLRLVVPGAGAAAGGAVRVADGVVTLPLPSGAARTACVENLGRRPLLLAGEPGAGSTIRGRPQRYLVAYELVTRHPARWSADTGPMLRHVGLARAGAGGAATGYVVLVLLGLAFAGALAATYRWVR